MAYAIFHWLIIDTLVLLVSGGDVGNTTHAWALILRLAALIAIVSIGTGLTLQTVQVIGRLRRRWRPV